jgi:hypothetical protein
MSRGHTLLHLTKTYFRDRGYFNPSVAPLRNNMLHTIRKIVKVADIPLSCLAIFLVGSSQCWNKTDKKKLMILKISNNVSLSLCFCAVSKHGEHFTFRVYFTVGWSDHRMLRKRITGVIRLRKDPLPLEHVTTSWVNRLPKLWLRTATHRISLCLCALTIPLPVQALPIHKRTGVR